MNNDAEAARRYQADAIVELVAAHKAELSDVLRELLPRLIEIFADVLEPTVVALVSWTVEEAVQRELARREDLRQ